MCIFQRPLLQAKSLFCILLFKGEQYIQMKAVTLSVNDKPKNLQTNLDKGSPQLTEISSMSPRPNGWTYEENQSYILFLRENRKEFQGMLKRKISKIYLEMSLNLRNKTPQQCRTHHQKSLKKYQTIENIINRLLPDMKKKLQRILLSQPQLLEESSNFSVWGAGNQLTLNISLQFMKDW